VRVQAEDRTRKRVKLLIPREDRSPSPPTLPHLVDSPAYSSSNGKNPQPAIQHLSYSAFVMDKGVTQTFRSSLLDELEQATNALIEGEGGLRRALGRLWKVIAEEAEPRTEKTDGQTIVPKREEEEEDLDERARKLARAPDLTPAVQKLFMFSSTNGVADDFEPSHFNAPEKQIENLERSTAILRELLDDGREYVERLEEIRESVGDARAQRNAIWDMVRSRAIEELQHEAVAIGED
jgi:hypothetical protein